MKIVFLFALLLFATSAPQKPDRQATQGNGASNAKTESPIIVVNNRDASKDAEQAKAEAPNWYASVWANGANWALVAVGIATFIAVWKQAVETAKATKAMRDSLPHQETAADAAKRSADAAKLSADIAARVSVPTLSVEKFSFGYTGAASLAAILQYPNVEMVIRNYGQTPAFLRSWTIIFTCEELPEIPTYSDYPGCGIILEKQVVKPGESYTMPKLEMLHRQRLSDDDIRRVIDGDKMLTAYGYICYGDLFGNPLRRLKFCEFALNVFEFSNTVEWLGEGDDPVYSGTDTFPAIKSIARQGTGRQAAGTDAETENNPEKAN